MRTGARRVLATLVLFAAGALVASEAAAATQREAVRTAWWWTGRPSGTFPLRLDPVPPVPEGGLHVGSNPSGATAVSALRAQVDEDVRDVVLTLVVRETIGVPLVDACPAADAWEPERGGSWDQRPRADCASGRASGVPGAGGTTLAFDVGSLVRMGTLDIVLLPRAVPDAPAPPTFSSTFDAVDGAALAVGEPAPRAISAPPPVPTVTAGATEPVTPAPEPFHPVTVPPRATDDVAVATPAPAVARVAPAVSRAVADGFRYSVVLVLPLALLGGGGYVGWALTRPVIVPARRARPGQP